MVREMDAGKRTPEQIKRDRALISSLMLKGYSTKQIRDVVFDEHGYILSDGQIALAKRNIRDDWFKSQIINYTALLAQELDRLDVLEAELWSQLRLSAKPQTRKTIERYLGRVSDQEGREEVSKIIESELSGDVNPKYFDLIIRCQQERRKLLGLYAPEHKTVSHDVAIKGYTIVSPGDWDNPVTIEGEYEQS